jgi:excisionase family DNA binding protein
MGRDKKLLRMEAAASALGISHWTLRVWANQGHLRTVRLGRLRMVPVAEVDRIARQGIGRWSKAANG